MYYSNIDFQKISQAINGSLEVLNEEQTSSEAAMQKLQDAKEQLQQALSFSLSMHK